MAMAALLTTEQRWSVRVEETENVNFAMLALQRPAFNQAPRLLVLVTGAATVLQDKVNHNKTRQLKPHWICGIVPVRPPFSSIIVV